MAPYQDPAGVDVDFRNISRCHKAYRKYCQSQVAAYGFTPGEVDVLTVLSNNPQIDTAADISQFRNISKALVCRSVDALVRQGFLLSAPDEKDRRLQHLSLTEEAAPIAAALQECRRTFIEKLTEHISPEDMDRFQSVLAQMAKNVWKEGKQQ